VSPYAAPDGAARLAALLAGLFPDDLARERARGACTPRGEGPLEA
jgi:hypothetical protein